MTAAIPPWLTGELLTPAWCWHVSRRDGVVVALTSHDHDLQIGDTVYRAAPGLSPSALEEGDALDGPGLDIAGALTSDAITAADIDAGRWDGAQVTVSLADWTDPAAAPVPIAAGELGAIAREQAGFTAELTGASRLLDQPVAAAASPTCRAALGDPACRVNLAPLTFRGAVTALTGRRAVLAAVPALPSLAFGRLRWLAGPWRGLVSLIVAHDGAALELASLPGGDGAAALLPHLPLAVELVAGCDKQLATCAGRFANAANFQGEPHLPGNDLLTRYPGG